MVKIYSPVFQGLFFKVGFEKNHRWEFGENRHFLLSIYAENRQKCKISKWYQYPVLTTPNHANYTIYVYKLTLALTNTHDNV